MRTDSSQSESITSSTIVAIVVIVFSGLWIAFAYYHASSAQSGGVARPMLLHPIVAILLIALLGGVRRLIAVKSVINILIAMIGVWLFTNLLGVLMPFILGFGLAYFFRFLLNAMQDIPLPRGGRLQLSRGYAHAILTAITLGAFALLFLYIIPQIGTQSREMSKGLVRFYHQSIVPFTIGNDFRAIALQPDNPTVIYLGTEHGVYRRRVENNQMEDLTGDVNFGQPIQAVAATPGGNRIYIGTAKGLYARKRVKSKEKGGQIWELVEAETFDGKSVQAIAVPPYNPSLLYVGTRSGCYRLNRFEEWEKVQLLPSGEMNPSDVFSVWSIAFSSSAAQAIYIASNHGIYASQDGGITWSLMSSEMVEDLPIRALAVVAVNGGEAIFGGTSKGFYQWQEEAGWVSANFGIDAAMDAVVSVPLLASLPSQPVFYAGHNKMLYRQATQTGTWEAVLSAKEGILYQINEHPALADLEIVGPIKDYLTTKLPTLAQTGSEFIGQLVKRFSSIAIGFGGVLTTAFLTLMVFIYASQSFKGYIQSFINLFPQDARERVKLYLTEIDRNLQSFLRGQVVVILIVSLISIVVYSFIGVPFALVVGLLAGLCNAIPTFGPFIGGAFAILALLMGFAAGNFEGAGFLIRIAVLLGAIFGIQAIDNSLISPRVMSSAVDVDPLLIMFGVIVGASILGFWGVLLAIPIIVVIKSILNISRQIRTEEAEQAQELKENAKVTQRKEKASEPLKTGKAPQRLRDSEKGK